MPAETFILGAATVGSANFIRPAREVSSPRASSPAIAHESSVGVVLSSAAARSVACVETHAPAAVVTRKAYTRTGACTRKQTLLDQVRARLGSEPKKRYAEAPKGACTITPIAQASTPEKRDVHVENFFERKERMVREKLGREPFWDRSKVLSLADGACRRCDGIGIRWKGETDEACACVYRSLFRLVHRRWQDVAYGNRVRFRCVKTGPSTWSRPHEELAADFELVSRRHLSADEYPVFRLHMLQGVDYRSCCRELGIDKARFFYLVYRIQEQLGRVFRSLRPFALCPVDEYLTPHHLTADSLCNNIPASKPLRVAA